MIGSRSGLADFRYMTLTKVYVKGKKNVVADALSKRRHLCSLVEIAADWRELISAEYWLG